MELDGFYLGLIVIALFLIACTAYIYANRGKLKESLPFFFLLWNLLISTTIIFTFFVACESYFRFGVDRTDAFAISKVTMRWMNRHYEANNVGVRDNIDYNQDRSMDKRLTFVGDSFTAGHGIKNVENRFVNLIRTHLPTSEVHTICANGLESDDQLFLINKFRQDGYQFDKTLLIYNLNDIAYLSPERERIYDKLKNWSENQSFLLRESYFINLLWTRWVASTDAEISQYYAFVKSSYQSDAWKEHQKTLKNMIKSLHEIDSELMVVTFPFISDLSQNYDFLSVHKQLSTFWDQQNIPHLDMWHIFKGLDPKQLMVNKYDPHPNEEAHLLASKAIIDFLNKAKTN